MFSILIPTYKDTFLKECIDSVLSQTFTDFEIIIVNDASPYSIDSIVEQYRDNRIKYYKNEKGFGAKNVVGNWNKCLSYANGDYVICMGDDDMLLPNCLNTYINCIMANPNYEVYHIRTEIINENGDIIDMQEARPEQESVYSLIWHKVNNKRIQFIGDFCFRTASLKIRKGFFYLPFACYSDDISVYMAARNNGIRNINEIGFRYRTNTQTISNTQDLRETITGAEQAFEFIKALLNEKADNPLDETLRLLSIKILPKYTNGIYHYCIQTDMIQSPFSSLRYWKSQKRKFKINNSKIIRLFYIAIKFRIKKSIHNIF